MNARELWRRAPGKARLWREVIANHGDHCWLCGGPGADTLDHLLPKRDYPELMFALENLRPAHRSCNSRRGAKPVGRAPRRRRERVVVADGW